MHVRWYCVLLFLLMLVIVPPLSAQSDAALKAVWSPASDQIAVFDRHKLVIYDAALAPQQEIAFFTSDDPASLATRSIAWSPLADKIAASIYNAETGAYSIRAWDVKTGEQVGEIMPAEAGRELTWLPDNEQVAVLGYDDGGLSIYKLDGTLADEWDFLHKNPYDNPDTPDDDLISLGNVIDFAWTSDGYLLVIALSNEPPLSYWSVESKEWIKNVWNSALLDIRIYLNPSGKTMLLFSPNAVTMEIRNIATENLEIQYRSTDAKDDGMAVLQIAAGWRDSSHVWSIGDNGTLYLWRPKVEMPISKFSIDLEHFRSINPDGTLVFYSKDGDIWIEEVETNKVLARISQADDTPFSGEWFSPLFEYPYLDDY